MLQDFHICISVPLMQILEISLQERQLDVGCALANVSVVKNSLEVFKNEVVSKHNVWFQITQLNAEELNVTVKRLRAILRQKRKIELTHHQIPLRNILGRSLVYHSSIVCYRRWKQGSMIYTNVPHLVWCWFHQKFTN